MNSNHLSSKVSASVEILRQAKEKFGDKLVYPTSLGSEAIVLIDLICRYLPGIPMLSLDTGKLPAETLKLWKIIEMRYSITISRLTPDPEEVRNMCEENGEELYRKSVELRKLCCDIRKVRPLARAVAGKAWITGRRREQSSSRSQLEAIETHPNMGLAKCNPLIEWTSEDVWTYIRQQSLPYNTLYDQHYRSIGCAPCTRAIAVGEDERAGRWWWEQEEVAAECGLHMNPLAKQPQQETMTMNPWQGKRVLITGVCGTIGSELLRQVVARDAYEVIGIDNNETELFFLDERYRDANVHLYLGDLRDKDKLMRKMQGVDIVLHAAALKHVILCEKTPRDAVQTNILGTQNIIDAAIANGVERVIFTSSDKAVNPTNVMGTTKLMGERLMTAANAHRRGNGPIFASTRFGNVLGSRGSVIPLFKKQIQRGGPVTLTDPDMTRFIMTIEQASALVLDSVFLACGGEVFVTKMPVVRIQDVAEVMIDVLANEPESVAIEVIGSKPGEKLYEELMNDEETRRTLEMDNYFVVLPAFKAVYESIVYDYPNMGEVGVDDPYNSALQPAMSKETLRAYLLENHLLTAKGAEGAKGKV